MENVQDKIARLQEVFAKGIPTAQDFRDLEELYQDPAVAGVLKSFDTNEGAGAVAGGKAPKKDGVTDDEEGNTGQIQGDSTLFDHNEPGSAVTGGAAPKKDGVTDSPEGNKGTVAKSLGDVDLDAEITPPAVDLPAPDALTKSLSETPQLQEVMDAVEPVARIASHGDQIVKGLLAIIERQDQMLEHYRGVRKSLRALDLRVEGLEGGIQKSVASATAPAAAPAAEPVQAVAPELLQNIAKSLGDLKGALENRVSNLENVVSSAPVNPHPQVVNKSVGGPVITREVFNSTIRKGVEASKLGSEEGCRALRVAQQVSDLQLPDVVRQFAPAVMADLGLTH